MADTPPQALVDLIRASGPAHHQAYLQTNGHDPEWPLWYSDYLYADLQSLLEGKFTKSELVYWLVRVDKEFRTGSPKMDWPTFYAMQFSGYLGKD